MTPYLDDNDMATPFFVMQNVHSPSCGTPPTMTNATSGKYFGYFENEHGEQWTFIFDRAEKTAELRGGDAGWENVYRVEDGRASDLVLSAKEARWLQACWEAATTFQR